jgi:MFS family permease
MTSTYNWAIISAISLGSFNYGFTFGAPSTALGIAGFLRYFGVNPAVNDPGYSNSMQGGRFSLATVILTYITAIVGVFFAGGFFSSFFSAWLADKLGRKRTLDILNLISVVAVILQAGAVNVAMLLVGRILAGVG